MQCTTTKGMIELYFSESHTHTAKSFIRQRFEGLARAPDTRLDPSQGHARTESVETSDSASTYQDSVLEYQSYVSSPPLGSTVAADADLCLFFLPSLPSECSVIALIWGWKTSSPPQRLILLGSHRLPAFSKTMMDYISIDQAPCHLTPPKNSHTYAPFGSSKLSNSAMQRSHRRPPLQPHLASITNTPTFVLSTNIICFM